MKKNGPAVPREAFVLAAALWGLAPGCHSMPGVPKTSAVPPPNLILILADDMGYADLACFGGRAVPTPHLDRLARSGMKFTRFYAASAVCTPTRASILTGRFPLRFDIRQHFTDEGDCHLPRGTITLPRLLREAGYATAHVGKWHLGGLTRAHARDRSRAIPGPREHGFEHYLCQIEEQPLRGDLGRKRRLYRDGGTCLLRDDVPVPPDDPYYRMHFTDIVGQEAVRLVEQYHREKRPFFLNLWHLAPHTPYEPGSEPWYGKTAASGISEDQHCFRSMVAHLDATVGALLDKLERLGLRDDTMIVFTSDNGGAWESDNGPFKGGKTDLHEGGLRVPMIASWPGKIPAGWTSDAVSGTVDLLPTFCAAAGVARPETASWDGLNLLPHMTGGPDPGIRTLLWQMDLYPEIQRHAPKPQPYATEAAVRGPWKLLARDGRPLELFDLLTDPGENDNLLDRHPEVAGRLAAEIRGFLDSPRDRSGFPDSGRSEPPRRDSPPGRLVGHWGEQEAGGRERAADVPDLLDLAQGNTAPDDGSFRARQQPSNRDNPPAGPPPRWSGEAWVGRTALEFRGEGNVAVVVSPETAAASLERMRETLSVAAWVRLDNMRASGWTQIASVKSSWYLERHGDTGMSGTRYPGFWVNLDGFEGEKGFRNVRGRTSLNDGAWHHVAATYDSPRQLQAIYVDGELENTAKVTGKLRRVAGETINIGGRFNGYSSWDGLIDDVRVYDYALAPEEIRALALAGRNVIPKIRRLGLAGGGSFVPRLDVPAELEAAVSDLNGDPLEYLWSADPSEGVAFIPGPGLRSPRVSFARPGAYRLTLRVDDGKVGFRHPDVKGHTAASFTVIAGLARSEPVDLGGAANRSRYGTLNRGWFGLRSGLWLGPGTYRIGGVDFDLPREPDSSASVGRSVVALACGLRELKLEKHQSDEVLRFPVESGPIPVRRRADALFFLHTAAFAHDEPAGTVAWEYVIRYEGEDAAPEIVPVRLQRDVANEVYPLGESPPIPGEALGATDTWLYVQRWDNPRPDRVIESVVARSRRTRAAGILVALCTGHKTAAAAGERGNPGAAGARGEAGRRDGTPDRTVVKEALSGVCSGVDYRGERIGGYLGHWVDRNIADELLGFPLDVYLKPLKTMGPNDSLVLGKTAKDEYRQVVGEYLGKYLHAMVLAYDYVSEDDVRRALKSRMDEIVAAWRRFQRPNGSLSVVQEGSPSGKWLWWESKYCLLGLLSYYGRFGGDEVLACARRHGDFICDKFNTIKTQDSGDGVMLESLVLLYRHTGDRKYLDKANWMMTSALNEISVAPLLNGGPAAWTGTARKMHEGVRAAHGYVTLSILIGILQLARLTGENPDRLRAVKAAVEDIVARELYVTGGSTWKEHFHGSASNLKGEQADMPQEACAAAHWLYLNRELFHLTGEARYVDNIELTLYNALLGSENPRDGFESSYYSPLQGIRHWVKTTPRNIPGVHFFHCTPCCTTSSTREIVRLPECLWAKYNDDGLAVLVYNPGVLREAIRTRRGERVDTTVTVAGDYPLEGRATVTVRPKTEAAFKVNLRVPVWCEGFTARVQGGPALAGKPGAFLTIDRTWSRAGETIDVSFELPVRVLDGGPNYPGHKALRRGVQVLVVDRAVNPSIDFTGLKIRTTPGLTLKAEPTARLPRGWVGSQVYSTPALNDGSVYLVPYADAGQLGTPYWTWIRQ